MSLFNKKTPVTQQPIIKIDPNKRDFTQGLVTTKDIIAPSSIEVDFNHIRIDNKYYRTLFVAAYPRFVGINWLSSLINFDASLNISMFVYPTDGKEVLDDLRRKITEMEAELSTDIQRGRLVNPATQAKLEDALDLQTNLVKGEERFFQFGLYITINADSTEELERTNKNLEAALGSLLIVSKKATLQMEDGFVTTLPICQDKLAISRNMDTTSLATTFPFVSSDLSDDKGIMYGINMHNGSLVIFDRFSMPNYNSVVFATAGAGKSYLIKLEVIRSLMMGTEIIVIDPENEYRELCTTSGGQYIAFGYEEGSKINPFDLTLAEEEGENGLNTKILSLHKLLKVMLGDMDPIEESIMDRAMMDAYKMKGITPDPATQNKEPPLIEDLYKSLIGMEDEKAKSLAARLEKYIKGSFAGIFNQKTTVNLTSSFVVFGIKDLEDVLRPVAMQIILDYIWTVVKKTLKKRILVVDEAWYLMQHEDSASFLRGIVKRGRKYYLGVTTITQDVDDFLETDYGKEIVTNSSIQILLKQHSAAIDQIGEVFYLSEGEKQFLMVADKGEGIFFAGQNHVAIKVIASEDEHKMITSNPEDILQKQKLLNFQKPISQTPPILNNESSFVKTETNKTIEITQPVLPVRTDDFQNQQIQDIKFIEKPKLEVAPKITIPEIKTQEIEMNKTIGQILKTETTPTSTNQDIKNEIVKPVQSFQQQPQVQQNQNQQNRNEPFQQIQKQQIQSEPIRQNQNESILFKKPEVVVLSDNNKRNDNFITVKTDEIPKIKQPITQQIKDEIKKPIFVKNEEEYIPQPPQLNKRPQPVFNSPEPKTIEEQEKKLDDSNKMDYDKLFGDGIV